MKNEFKWRYSRSGNNSRSGINDAGIESYTGNRIFSLAKEICQNSLDARLDKKIPVMIEFKEYEMKRENFPDLNGLKTALKNSYYESMKLTDTTSLNFFKNAINVIEEKEIPFLRISDFNTKGLKGVNKTENSSWDSLVKSSGISNKETGSGGSFGIGKTATFATSNLRTVLYSTFTEDEEVATQGVSVLISYDIQGEDDYTQGKQYLAVDNKNNPLLELVSYDSSYKRNEFGTDIYVAGFIKNKDSENEIVKAILNTYLYAVYYESLIVEVNNIKISKETLEELINNFKEELDQTTVELFELLINKEAKTFYDEIIEENDLEIRIILNPNGSRKVSIIRNPWMKIKDEKGFPTAFKFQAFAVIKGKELNEALRRIENPQHNNWEPDRLQNVLDKEKVRKYLSSIRSKILNRLRELYNPKIGEFQDIFGASDYLPLEGKSGKPKAQDKIDDKILEIEFEDIELATKLNVIDEFSDLDGDFISDTGDEDVLEPIKPINNESKFKTNNILEDYFKRGKKIGIKKSDVRVISINKDEGKFRIVVDLNENYLNTILKISVLDENEAAIKDSVKIIEAIVNGEKKKHFNNFIKSELLKTGINIIDIKTDLVMYVGLGVEINEN